MKGWRKVGEKVLVIKSDAERAADGLFFVGYRVKIVEETPAGELARAWRVTWYERETVPAPIKLHGRPSGPTAFDLKGENDANGEKPA